MSIIFKKPKIRKIYKRVMRANHKRLVELLKELDEKPTQLDPIVEAILNEQENNNKKITALRMLDAHFELRRRK